MAHSSADSQLALAAAPWPNLDHLAGAWSAEEAKRFEAALRDQRTIDPELLEMTRILADTSAYSAFFRGHAGVKRCFQKAEEIVLTPVVLGELRAGFLCGKHMRKNDRELAMFLASDRVVVLPVDAETYERYAVILSSLRTACTPVSINDVWIAATAMQHGLSVVTTDPHFANIPQILCEVLPVLQQEARSATHHQPIQAV